MSESVKHTTEASRRGFLQALGTTVPSVVALAHSETVTPPSTQSEGGDPSYAHFTLDAVARNKREVLYEEIADCYGGPMSRAPIISVKGHPEVIWIRPDLGIGMAANPLAFAVDNPPVPIPWRNVERSLRKGYMPIVTSRAPHNASLLYEQLAYACLLKAGPVRTGYEKQILMLRMSVVNTRETGTEHASWWLFPSTYIPTSSHSVYRLFGDYTLFDVVGALPDVQQNTTRSEDRIIRAGDTVLGCYDAGPGVKATSYGNAIRFEMDLLPGQKKHVVLRVSSNKHGLTAAELQQLQRLDFFSALDKRELELEAILSQGTQISVPEEIVNRIYKAQILYNQTQLLQAADRNYLVPIQGCVGFWPWEQMKQLVALDAFGYHNDVRDSLIYYLKLQGKRRPNADVQSYDGVFPSSPTFEESGWEQDANSTIYGQIARQLAPRLDKFPNWVNNTGSSLNAFAEHYFYTRDKPWLESVAPRLIKACDWISRERQATKRKNSSGEKVLEYGLMPAGQPYDTENSQKPDYYLCMTDGYTYQGFHRIAEALVDIGHPDGTRLLGEADDYGRDIREVMRRVRQRDPNLPPYPEHLNGPDAWGSLAAGAISLVDVGLLDPPDAAFTQLEDYMKRHFNLGVLGLSGRCHQQDARIQGSYYMVTTEDIYHYAWLVRGDVEKALLSFYSTLAFGVDKQTLGAIERFSLYDRRYSPFFIDSSGGMRICGMIRRVLLMERGSDLHVLSGAPRRWLEFGKQIEVRKAPTYFGSVDLTVKSAPDADHVRGELVFASNRQNGLKNILFRIPHPSRQSPRNVRVNGQTWKHLDPAKEIVVLPPGEKRYDLELDY